MSYLTITKPERCSTKFWETISKTLEEHCESEFDETSMEFHTLWDSVFVDVESSSSLDCLSLNKSKKEKSISPTFPQ